MKAALYQGVENIEITELPDYKCAGVIHLSVMRD